MSLSGARGAGLTSRCQPESGDSRVGEQPPLDGTRERLGCAVRSLPTLPAVNDRWHGAADGRVSPPVIVVLREVIQELAQVIQPSDNWNAPEPFLLQCQNRALGDRNGTMFADRAETRLGVPVYEWARASGTMSATHGA